MNRSLLVARIISCDIAGIRKSELERTMQIFVVGMIRSGSTLHFNMIRELLEAAKIPFDYAYAKSYDELEAMLARPHSPDVARVFKLHFFDQRLESIFATPNAHAFFIHRNILDVAASLIRKTSSELDDLIDDLKSAFWSKHSFMNMPTVHISQYEEVLVSNQLELAHLRQCLGLEISQSNIVEIAERLSIENQRKQLEELEYTKIAIPADSNWSVGNERDIDDVEKGYVLVNEETQLHHNHITSDGQTGSWQDVLTSAQASKLCALEAEIAQKAFARHKDLLSKDLYSSQQKCEQLSAWLKGKEVQLEAKSTDIKNMQTEYAEATAQLGAKSQELETAQSQIEDVTAQLETEHAAKLKAIEGARRLQRTVERNKVELSGLQEKLADAEKYLAIAEQIRQTLIETHEQWRKERETNRHHAINLYAWHEVARGKHLTGPRLKQLPLLKIEPKLELLALPQISLGKGNNPSRPKISVITPSFNSGADIERAIKSVQAQKYDNWEHIIIDGGSTDGTLETLKHYHHLIWKSEKDRGQVDAMNKGFAMANGDIIAYLNADDYYKPDAFEKVVQLFDNDNVKIVYGNVHVYDAVNDSWWMNKPRYDFRSVLHHWEPNAFCVNPVGYFYKREVQESVPILENDGAKHDLAFLIGVAKNFERQSKKTDACLGVFVNAQDTQTAREQSVETYWTPENFSFLDRFVSGLSEIEVAAFRKAQEAGYELRRTWLREAQERALSSAHES